MPRRHPVLTRRALAAASLGIALVGALGAEAQTPAAQAASANPPAPRHLLTLRDRRPTLSLGDGRFTMQPVLRLDTDFGGFWGQPGYHGGQPPKFLDGSRPGVPDEGINVRRARLGLRGTFLRDFSYNFTWELAPGVGRQFEPGRNSRLFELQVAWAGFSGTTLRAGVFTPMHLIEYSMSSFELPLLERPAIVNIAASLASGTSRIGLGGEARGDRWFASAYATNGAASTLDDGHERGVAGRAAGLVVDEPRMALLVGANGAAQFHPGTSPGAQSFHLRDYPELRLDPTRLLDTRRIDAGSGHALGPEMSGLIGPVYVQGEYQWVHIDANGGAPNRDFWGYYLTAALPLLGGPRRYEQARGVFTRPRFGELDPAVGHWGWAEVVARWSYVSLDSGPVRGGRQGILHLGLNYYPTSHLRLSLQYSRGAVKLDGPDRSYQALAGRISFDW
ncbi:MAG TPA: porin [Thermoanaerobaculia bacterium]|nr:porin [Thermoanaerobaculia bacterium]